MNIEVESFGPSPQASLSCYHHVKRLLPRETVLVFFDFSHEVHYSACENSCAQPLLWLWMIFLNPDDVIKMSPRLPQLGHGLINGRPVCQ